ncbi:hypothetical protein D3C80_1351220 [compost metagenome]
MLPSPTMTNLRSGRSRNAAAKASSRQPKPFSETRRPTAPNTGPPSEGKPNRARASSRGSKAQQKAAGSKALRKVMTGICKSLLSEAARVFDTAAKASWEAGSC